MNYLEVDKKAEELYTNLKDGMYEERLIAIEQELQSNKDNTDTRFYQAKQAELNLLSAELSDVYSELKADYDRYIAQRYIETAKEMSIDENKGSFTLADNSKIKVGATLLSHTLKHMLPGEVPHLYWVVTKLELVLNRITNSIQTARNFVYNNKE